MENDEQRVLPPRQRSFLGLLRDLRDDSAKLARQQVRLAKIKLSQNVSEKAKIYGMMGAGGIVAICGFIVLLLGFSSLLSMAFGADSGAQAGGQLIIGSIVTAAGGAFTFVVSRHLAKEDTAVGTPTDEAENT